MQKPQGAEATRSTLVTFDDERHTDAKWFGRLQLLHEHPHAGQAASTAKARRGIELILLIGSLILLFAVFVV